MSTRSINLGEFSVQSNDRLRATIYKDGAPWTGIDSVAFVFEAPDQATQITRAGQNELPDVGVWYFDRTPAELNTPGGWSLNVRVTDGSVVKRYPYPIRLHVVDEP